MRRPRTFEDWMVYGLAACVAILLALAICMTIDMADQRRQLRGMNLRIQEQAAPDQPATGGAEVPIPEIATGAAWRFPIAESDYRAYTSPFGYRVSPLLHVEMYHTGVDIAATWRAQVVAVADGVITEHWPAPGTPYPGGGVYRGHAVYGGMVEIEHADGLRTLYAHLSSTRIHTGDHVRAGEVIGRVGNTGKSDGEHLHMEVIGPDGPENPLLYIQDPAHE